MAIMWRECGRCRIGALRGERVENQKKKRSSEGSEKAESEDFLVGEGRKARRDVAHVRDGSMWSRTILTP
jgi:hypothetical protein